MQRPPFVLDIQVHPDADNHAEIRIAHVATVERRKHAEPVHVLLGQIAGEAHCQQDGEQLEGQQMGEDLELGQAEPVDQFFELEHIARLVGLVLGGLWGGDQQIFAVPEYANVQAAVQALLNGEVFVVVQRMEII